MPDIAGWIAPVATMIAAMMTTGGVGGIAEQFRPVPRERVTFGCHHLVLGMSRCAFEAYPPLAAGDWPAQVTEQAVAA